MRIAVTGVGAVSAIGSGEAFFRALRAGACGIGEVTTFDPGDTVSVLAAEIPEFEVEDYLESAKTYLDRASAFTLAAGALALRDAAFAVAPGQGLSPVAASPLLETGRRGDTATQRDGEPGCVPSLTRSPVHPFTRSPVTGGPGLSLGTAYGCLGTMGAFWEGVLEKGPRLASSLLFTHSYANTPISLASIEFNVSGVHHCFCSGAASAGYALVNAVMQLRIGRARAILAGGGEALSPFLYAAYAGAGLLSPGAGGEEGLRPFAASRNGTVLGEGAGALLLETEEAALARGARLQAVVLGCGISARPGADGPRAAMELALADAGLDAGAVGAVFASADGSPDGDAWEAAALEGLFGSRPVPVVALKAAIGETLGAGGALAAIAAVHALQTGLLPGLAGTEPPQFRLNLVGSVETTTVRRVLVNTLDHQAGCVSMLLAEP